MIAISQTGSGSRFAKAPRRLTASAAAKQVAILLAFAAICWAETPDEAATLAIKAVRSVTNAGVTLRAYQDRVLEARVRADQAPGLDPNLKLALEYYETAMNAWSERFSRDGQSLARSVAIGQQIEGMKDCKPAVELTASVDRSFKKPPGPQIRYSMISNLLSQRPNLLRTCAADLIDGK